MIKEALKQEHDEPDDLTIAYMAGLYDGKKQAKQEQDEPVAWDDLLKDAQQIVKDKFLYKRFIDGTPLSNDIPCWMADFAQQYTTPQGCDECGNGGGYALYCLPCAEKFVGTKEWVGLMDEDEIPWDGVDAKSFAKAIEAKLKEKNA